MFETAILSPDVPRDPAFWATYLARCVRIAEGDPPGVAGENRAYARLLETLGVSRNEAERADVRLYGPLDAYAFLDEIDDVEVPPFARLVLGLEGGHAWHVRFHGGDDPGIYHELHGPDGPLALSDTYGGLVGWDDVYPELPILRPAEVAPLARIVAAHTPGVPEAAARLLFAPLAFRLSGSAASAAARVLHGALAALGLGTNDEARAELAGRLVPPVGRGFRVEDLYDDAQETVREAPFRWWNDGQGWRSNARGGFRHEGSSWHPDAFARVDAALGTADA